MITSTLVTSTSTTVPTKVFTSTTTGLSGGVGQVSAITTIMLCNTGTPNITNETIDAAIINVYLVKSGSVPAPSGIPSNLVVSNLTIPAGETVFFSEERIVLDSNDEIWVGQEVPNPSNPLNTSLVAVTVSSLPV